jgi:RHS repeat-associated protein
MEEARFPISRSTGKERDTESGNDYFGARYYASSMGRWLSPDWSAKVEPVPYAKLDDPQSLNLYLYLRNNPLAGVDADGHQQGGSDDVCVACDSLQGSPFEGITQHLGPAAKGYVKAAWNSLFAGQIRDPFIHHWVLIDIPAKKPANEGEAQGMRVAPLVDFLASSMVLPGPEAGVEIEGIFANPEALGEINTPKGATELGEVLQKEGWDVGSLGKGGHKGQGMRAIEYKNGVKTDRMIQWHPGGGHHGPGSYYKVSSGKGGTVRVFNAPKKPK